MKTIPFHLSSPTSRSSATTKILGAALAGLVFGASLLAADDLAAQERSRSQATGDQDPRRGQVQDERRQRAQPPEQDRQRERAQQRRGQTEERPAGPVAERRVLRFVREQHEDLVPYLTRLRSNHPQAYRQALQQLSSEVERLERMRERNPDQYQQALELWNVQSRIQLATARYGLEPDREALRELKGLVAQQLRLQHRRLQEERERIEARLERVDQQLERLRTGGEELVQQRVETIVREAQRRQQRLERSRDRRPE